jgi:hypothetical protein
MAFLDNSGDIILDAVLTDTGRKRLAQGDGSFKIVKFALGDDEIDYKLFNKSHVNGSAYYDLEIMQTPVLEAFTNNTSSLKHKLMSMPQTNLLYLPVIKLDDVNQPAASFSSNSLEFSAITASSAGNGVYFLPADDATHAELVKEATKVKGVLGMDPYLHIDAYQGLDTDEISFTRDIGSELRETQYIISVDNRLAKVVNPVANNLSATVSYIDDDQVATYYFSVTSDPLHVTKLSPPTVKNSVIDGPLGSKVRFNLFRSEEIETSTSLFNELGGGTGSVMTITGTSPAYSQDYLYIDTNVRITGATTGSSIDIPIRVMKKN